MFQGVSTQLERSVTKTFIGTNAYMAPERILGNIYTVRSDVWSLGVSILEMALGRFPYPTDAASRPLLPIELLHCIVYEAPPSLPAGIFRPELIEFSQLCLTQQPDVRPPPSDLTTHNFFVVHATDGRSHVAAFVESFYRAC